MELDQWREATGCSEWSVWPLHGKVEAWSFPPLARTAEGIAASSKLLSSLIMATLPGYGSGIVAGRCLVQASAPILLVERRRVVGFAALNTVRVQGLRCEYLTLTAIEERLQGIGLLQTLLQMYIDVQAVRPSILAATTNVPAVVSVFRRLSEQFAVGEDWGGGVLPFGRSPGPLRPVSKAVRVLGLDLLRAALGRPCVLDAFLVRRGYRTRDLQSEPAPDYFRRERHRAQRLQNEVVLQLLDRFDELHLVVGDAILILAPLDETLSLWARPKGGGDGF